MDNSKKMRFSESELKWFKDIFGGNEFAMKTIAKLFCPPLDNQAPPGQMFDIYLQIPTDQMPDEQVARMVRARNLFLNHMNMRLMELEILANMTEESEKEKEIRLKKDSSK